MRVKIIALIGALALCLGLALTFPTSTSPAVAGQAVSAHSFETGWGCVTYRNVTACNSLDWSTQSDGTGVRLEGIQNWTSTGCGSLEEFPAPYSAVYVTAYDRYGQVDYRYSYGDENCNFYKDVSNAVGTSGNVQISISMHMRVNGAADRRVYWVWLLRPGGTYVLQSSGDTSL